MKTSFGRAALTVLELDPVEQIDCAARTGYDSVSIRLVPATPEEPQRDTAGDTRLVRAAKQLCDGPAEGTTATDELMDLTRNERQIPGQGRIDVLAPIRALPPNILMVLEVPMRSRASASAENRARDVLSGARQLLADTDVQLHHEIRTARTEQNARG